MVTHLGQHAVVIGGSLAGLMTARVLADHFMRSPCSSAITSTRDRHCINRFLKGTISMCCYLGGNRSWLPCIPASSTS